jgi:uncharacterized iron-regulated membrane protein
MHYWYQIHKWSSLICALVMLMLCITGLPLIFHDELEDLLDGRMHMSAHPIYYKSLDTLVSAATAEYSEYNPQWVSIDYEKPVITIGLISRDTAATFWVNLDAYTGKIIDTSQAQSQGKNILTWILSLHANLFSGLQGQLFLGFIGLVFILALLSGCIVYKPFMRFTAFGTIRTKGSQRQLYSDIHKLIGIVVFVWAAIVTGTGILHTLSLPVYGYWQTTVIQPLLTPYQNQPVPIHLSSVQQAVSVAQKAVSNYRAAFINFPNPNWGSPYHYTVFTSGKISYTKYLQTPVLVDAATGQLTAVVNVPWYLRIMQLAYPLHFGNYGGLPLKVLWALLDMITIGVIVSGLYLWLLRKRPVLPSTVQPAIASPGLQSAEIRNTPQAQLSWKIWEIPLLLGLLTLLGCAAALLGTGIWQKSSWIFLSLPLLIGVWKVIITYLRS